MNRFCFSGRLTRDPEQRDTKTGINLAVITLAVGRDAANGGTDFVPITTWARLADRMLSYGVKGRLVEVEGYVRVKPYPSGPDQHKNPGIQFVAEKFKFLDSPKGNTEILLPECATIDVDEFFG